MKAFFRDYSGQAVIGLALTAGLITFPALAVWVASSITLIFSLERFRVAYARLVAAEEAASELETNSPPPIASRRRVVLEHDPRYWPPAL